MRFRRGYQTNQSSTSETRSRNDDDSDDVLPLTERDLRIISSTFWCARSSRSCGSFFIIPQSKKPLFVIFGLMTLFGIVGILLLLLQKLLDKLIPHDNSTFDDIFWRAIWLMPISYFKIHVFEHPMPTRPDFEYHLHNNNTFVINLDSDTRRWEQYQQMNKIGSRFSAVDFHSWMIRRRNNNNTRVYDDDDDEGLQRLLRLYPNLANLVQAGRYGEAGVMASHLRVYEQILQRNLSYAFIFEDDVLFRLAESSRMSTSAQNSISNNNGNSHQAAAAVIRAPHPTDVIFLTSTILRATHIRIPASASVDDNNDENHNHTANVIIRVMGGSGTYGLLVTNQGAWKILSLLQQGSCGFFDCFHDCRVDPLDIAIMKLAARHGLQIYTPFPARPVQFYHSSLGKTSSAKSLRDSVHA